jgi:hypothetical protein
MTEDEFWEIIAKSQPVHPGTRYEKDQEQIKRLHELLSNLSLEELGDYYYLFSEYFEALYRWDIWNGAWIIDGLLSDDGFMDFRYWLISRGKDAYYRVLNEPDILGEFASEDMKDSVGLYILQFEEFGMVARNVYTEKTGRENCDEFGCVHSSQIPHMVSDWEEFQKYCQENEAEVTIVERDPTEPLGERIDHDDEEALRRRYPRIMARFWNAEHGLASSEIQ